MSVAADSRNRQQWRFTDKLTNEAVLPKAEKAEKPLEGDHIKINSIFRSCAEKE